jgi:putative membrane protein
MSIIINWVVSALAIMVAAYLLSGVVVDSIVTALVLAVVLGAINAFIRPVLIILSLPVTILTLGLFVFIIDAALIMLAASIVPGFAVAGFWWALIFAVVLSVVHFVLGHFAGDKI